jgi:hypothetical protein
MQWTIPWAAVLLSLTPAAASAQDACAENFKWPAVGQWAEYQGTYDKQTPITSRYAVVGTEQRNGTEYKWIELKMHDEKKNKDMVYQMLVPGGPLQLDQVEEVVMKVGTDPAMKMSGMLVKMMRGQLAKSSAFKDACTDAALVGVEKVTVPAGTFSAKHFKSTKYATESWIDPAIPFTMLKSVGKSHDIQLVATGKGAKSSITETPKEMGGMGQ